VKWVLQKRQGLFFGKTSTTNSNNNYSTWRN
jgi:hypothetical protein